MLALRADVLLDPLQVGLALRKARQEVLARHAGVAHAELHDQALLAANDRHHVTQVAHQRVEQLRREFQLHDLIGHVGVCLHGAPVFEAVQIQVFHRAVEVATDDPYARFYFIRIGTGIDDFLVIIGLRSRRLDFVRLVGIDKTDDKILHAGIAGKHAVGNFQQRLDCWREMHHVVLDLVQAVLDALGDLDLALTGKQLNRAHFAHVHAYRVGRAAKLGVDAGQRLFRFLNRVVVGGLGIGEDQRLGIRRLFVHGDAHIVNHVNDVFDLLRIDDVVGQVIVDFGVGQVALFLAARNQFLELLRLLADTVYCFLFCQGEFPTSKKYKRLILRSWRGVIQRNLLSIWT